MNLFIKIISAVLSLVISFFSSATPERKCNPKFTGSFLQSWLSEYWEDEDWDKQIKEMKDDGVDYLILQSVAEKEDGKWTVYYDSAIDEFQTADWGGNDVIAKGLKACQKYGVKVFVGLALYDDWWLQGGNTSEYSETCKLMADMTEEIYNTFGEEYKDTLCGFYFTPEIGSSVVCTSSIKQISAGINTIIDRINDVCPDMTFMLSPFMFESSTAYMATSVLSMWVKFFDYTNFRDGDIFCPQDSIGVNTTKLKNADKMWQMYAKAVSTSSADVKLWANCENFTSANSSQKGTGRLSEENTTDVTATLDRFTQQLDIASRYVDNIVTFSYNHHYSRYQNNSVFADTYVDYVKNGYTLENQAPTAVSDLAVTRSGDTEIITWSPSSDNIGIAYYRITVNGKLLGRIEATTDGVATTYTDTTKRSTGTVYAVTAVDGAGNVSPEASATFLILY